MKKLLLLLLMFISINLVAQRVELIDLVQTDVRISKGLYMTSNLQSFYEGSILYIDYESFDIQYNFYFSYWDSYYVEFIIYDQDGYQLDIIRFNNKNPIINNNEYYLNSIDTEEVIVEIFKLWYKYK